MRYLILLFLLVLFSGPLPAEQIEQQRIRFLDAWDRLAAREPVDVDAAVQALDGYPLAPYLYWQDLRYRLDSVDPVAVQRFVERYPSLPVVDLLRSQWLHQLGRDKRWSTFLDALGDQRDTNGAVLSCYRLRALMATQSIDDRWIRDARALWTVGYSQPNACDPVFEMLYERDLLDADDYWQRIRLIMRSGNDRLARVLRYRLNESERAWLDRWLAVAADPAGQLRAADFDLYAPRGREILENGLQRLAARDRGAALELLTLHADERLLTAEQRLQLRRQIALRAAWSRDDDALALLEALPESAINEDVREWAARVALGQQDWQRLLGAIWALPLSQQHQAEWRYWKAEALRQTGAEESASVLFGELARERHYYGFLAADQLGLPYAINHQPTDIDASRLTALQERVAVQRARELYLLGLAEEARREWQSALADMDADAQRHASALALQWGWYDRAVHTANRARLHDDMDLRFPVVWEEKFKLNAGEQGVDLAFAYAISRKESAFNPDARSPVGALGLMQVMPGTGALVSRRLGLPAPGKRGLTDPDVNLKLGSAYLAQMLERFDGNLIMAAAAYNAGPGRVEGWQKSNAGQPAAVWIENITYGETRDYVKSVLAFRAVYDWQLRGEARSLAQVMPTMLGPDEYSPAYALRDADDER